MLTCCAHGRRAVAAVARARSCSVCWVAAARRRTQPGAAGSRQAAPRRPTPAQEAPRHAGGEANLVLPDLGAVDFHGINGRTLLMVGPRRLRLSAWRSAW